MKSQVRTLSSRCELRPLYEDLVPQDLRAIPEERWREVVSALNSLKDEPALGKPLVYQPLMGGDLSDCRSLAVTDIRIVYRILKERDGWGGQPRKVIEVIAVGYRQASQVYKLALERLGRRKKIRRRR